MSVQMRRPKARALASFAALLRYPQEDYGKLAVECKQMVELFYPGVSKCFSTFTNKISEMSAAEIEEVYTRTFDMAPLCNPYVTTYIYGDENFERGALMTRLAERYQESGFPLNGELPDHLAVILAFAPNFDNDELNDMIEFCLLGPMEKMCESLKDTESVYFFLLKALLAVLRNDQSEECSND